MSIAYVHARSSVQGLGKLLIIDKGLLVGSFIEIAAILLSAYSTVQL